MSDAILEDGPSHYYYIGRDRFSFAPETGTLPVEDDLGSSFQGRMDTDQLLSGIAGKLSALRDGSARDAILLSSFVSDFCRGMIHSMELRMNTLDSIRRRVECASSKAPVAEEVGIQTPAGFPNGSRVGPEIWQKLHSLAADRLSEYGYLITQRDKKYLSSNSGVEVTPYIWSTLISRMNLRRVRNPYSSSALVIYVPQS